ncbi:Bug family tripartite tricarboxylate transporter substrate binding protein [Pseudacidovorax intermedius]|uniref:Bug family tripartite tricarboxylate transporter substrate binding protein n=1 Tax=Pseudacidovorax intermedius TaxID=433924 RepID=UPI0026EC5B32|nr:Bug family tripartite tricarboxylate transporter substrate binding protein [Pseudacidovorax intermedius]
MSPRRTFHRFAAALALAALAGTASAQPALDGPLRIVVGYAPGGATDRVARIVADRLTAKLGVPVAVDNKAGAGGRLAAQQVKNTPAGQNVIMVANPAVMVVAPLVFKDNGYDPERDFQPLSNVNNYEFGLVVGSAVPVKQLSHLLAWMKANPEKANVGVPATGSLPHFFALMLGQKAQVKTEVVGYRGSSTVMTDLIGGQIPIAVDTFDVLLPQHESGKVRILAVSSAKRSAFAPDVPTFKEAGLDITALGWNAFFAPASMPRDKADRLAREIHDVMQEPDTQRKFTDARMQPVVSTRAETEAMLKAFRAQWAPVVKTSGYQP